MKTILESYPDKNIIYYLSDEEYEVFEKVVDNWDIKVSGKFTINKCLDFLKGWSLKFYMGYFENIKREEIQFPREIKGEKPNFVIIEEMVSEEMLKYV